MPAPTTLRGISATAGSNSPADTDVIGSSAAGYLRAMQAIFRQYLASVASNIASATTTDLSTADAFWVTITGTTTITGLGTESAGIWYGLTFNGALTFTHNGTSLILPGALNITTAAGDTCFAESLGSGNWRIWSYQRASGIPAIGPQTANTFLAGPTTGSAAAPAFRAPVGADGSSLVLLATAVAANSAQIDFATGITSTYDEYLITITDLIPATDATSLLMRVSEDAGLTFKFGATDYAHTRNVNTDAGTGSGGGSTGDAAMTMAATLSNTKPFGAHVTFGAPAGTARHKMFKWHADYEPSGLTIGVATGAGVFKLDTNAINGIRFFLSSGNITAGNFALYGIRKA